MGERLRSLRDHLAAVEGKSLWTQEAVAKRASIQRTAYNKMENGSSAFEGSSVAWVAKAFRLQYADFDRYIRGELTLENALTRRDPLASVFVERLGQHAQKLSRLFKKYPDRWHLTTLARALTGDTYVRVGENIPEVGWVSLLDSIESGQIDETEEQGEDAVRIAIERDGERGPRPIIPGFRTSPKRLGR